MIDKLLQNNKILYSFLGILLLIAYFHDLGLVPLIADEPTRALVAIEMCFSKNYVVPTINGEFYYRKPPLFNWILIGFFYLTGNFSEFSLRLAAVIPLFLFAFTIYKTVKKHLDKNTAFFTALMMLTFVRMISYDGMLAHIDIFYSWLTYMAFYLTFTYGEKNKWLLFFIIPYSIHAVAFLCKGLPSVLFAGITPIAYLLWRKEWKKIFHPLHFVAFGLFLIIIGAYFYSYSHYNSLSGWVDQLWDQSKQRTVIDKAWYEGFIHLFTFPLEHLGHLAPWAFFAVYFYKNNFLSTVKNNRFLFFTTLCLLANLPPYWLSPGYYPRYLFMLYPLFFTLVAHFYFQANEPNIAAKILHKVLLGIIAFLCLSVWAVFMVDLEIEAKTLKVISVFILLTLALLWFATQVKTKHLALVLALIAIKFAFTWIIWPHRLQHSNLLALKNGPTQAAQKTLGKALYLYQSPPLNHNAGFYISSVRNEQIIRYDILEPETYYIMHKHYFDILTEKNEVEFVDKFQIEYLNQELYLLYVP